MELDEFVTMLAPRYLIAAAAGRAVSVEVRRDHMAHKGWTS